MKISLATVWQRMFAVLDRLLFYNRGAEKDRWIAQRDRCVSLLGPQGSKLLCNYIRFGATHAQRQIDGINENTLKVFGQLEKLRNGLNNLKITTPEIPKMPLG